MEMSNAQIVPAPLDRTWQALNDPDVLQRCIPGCESIEKMSDNEYQLTMTAKVGPVSAKFKGKMNILNPKPPQSYALSFEGQGGAAGFAKGSAKVDLAPEGSGTRVAYTVSAQVGGKLAQIGSRLIDGAAKKIADDFFVAFANQLTRAPETETSTTQAVSMDKAGVASRGVGKWVWTGVVIVGVIVLYFLVR